mmetsp:Transcript_37477/g.66765  ORF Transcript_37477/g.66765 Transcript_37477/m.66765 type:complete len:84 (-) Transcript_37477:1153-1404(-)
MNWTAQSFSGKTRPSLRLVTPQTAPSCTCKDAGTAGIGSTGTLRRRVSCSVVTSNIHVKTLLDYANRKKHQPTIPLFRSCGGS